MDEKSKFKWWWPDVSLVEAARKATIQGMWAAIFVAGVTGLFAAYALASGQKAAAYIDAWAFVDSVIFGAIAFGLYKESRFAAVAGLVIFIIEKIGQNLTAPAPSGIFVAVVIIICFTGAVRGTYALRKLRAGKAG
jgi:hypothetical protein